MVECTMWLEMQTEVSGVPLVIDRLQILEWTWHSILVILAS